MSLEHLLLSRHRPGPSPRGASPSEGASRACVPRLAGSGRGDRGPPLSGDALGAPPPSVLGGGGRPLGGVSVLRTSTPSRSFGPRRWRASRPAPARRTQSEACEAGRGPPGGGGLRSRRGERRSRESRTPRRLGHAPLSARLVCGCAQRHVSITPLALLSLSLAPPLLPRLSLPPLSLSRTPTPPPHTPYSASDARRVKRPSEDPRPPRRRTFCNTERGGNELKDCFAKQSWQL